MTVDIVSVDGPHLDVHQPLDYLLFAFWHQNALNTAL
jgi:hypothetical protein